MFSQEQIATRIGQLGEQISLDYAGSDSLLLIGALRGAFIFLADLARRVTVPAGIDFVALSTYGDKTTAAREVRMIMDLRIDIENRDVLIVEDIVDTGDTLTYLQDLLRSRRSASLKTCALINKVKNREVSPKVEYVGFEVGDDWIVGYGLDHANRARGLPYLGVIDPPDEK